MKQKFAADSIESSARVATALIAVLATCIIALLVTHSNVAAAEDDYTVELYETYCQGCHSVAGAGVPVSFDAKDWSARIARKGIDGLIDAAINGKGNMPALGLCQECVYEDFEDLINYMSRPRSAAESE